MIVKLDMDSAYDRLNLRFIFQIIFLIALHFKVLDCSNGKWQTRKLSKVAEESPYLYIMIGR